MPSGPDPHPRRVYHLSTPRLLLLPAVWAVVMALLLIPMLSPAEADPAGDHALLVIAAAFTLILLPFFAITWQSRLVLTPQGIAHHQFGYTVRSTWDNLVALDLVAGREALFLSEPGTRSRLLRWSAGAMAWGVPALAQGLFGDSHALAQGRVILLAPFMQHWRRGPLRDDLQRWAPQLLSPGPTDNR